MRKETQFFQKTGFLKCFRGFSEQHGVQSFSFGRIFRPTRWLFWSPKLQLWAFFLSNALAILESKASALGVFFSFPNSVWECLPQRSALCLGTIKKTGNYRVGDKKGFTRKKLTFVMLVSKIPSYMLQSL
jgi:hypothetical protein